MTALTAPPTGRQSDCIFNNKPISSDMFLLLNFFVFCSNSLGVSITLFFFGGGREINTFIQQGCFKLIKSDDKDIRNLKKFLLRCFQHNNKCFLSSKSEYYRMISEGSFDWSNDAKNSALKSQE